MPSDNIPLFKKHYRHFNVESMKKGLEGKFKIIKVIGHYKISKLYELLYAFSTNKYLSIASEKYQKFLSNYFKKNIERAKSNNCKRLIFVCKKI